MGASSSRTRLRGWFFHLENRFLRLLDSFDKKFESLLVLGGNEEVLAHILVTAAAWVALIEAKDFIPIGLGSRLNRDH